MYHHNLGFLVLDQLVTFVDKAGRVFLLGNNLVRMRTTVQSIKKYAFLSYHVTNDFEPDIQSRILGIGVINDNLLIIKVLIGELTRT